MARRRPHAWGRSSRRPRGPGGHPSLPRPSVVVADAESTRTGGPLRTRRRSGHGALVASAPRPPRRPSVSWSHRHRSTRIGVPPADGPALLDSAPRAVSRRGARRPGVVGRRSLVARHGGRRPSTGANRALSHPCPVRHRRWLQGTVGGLGVRRSACAGSGQAPDRVRFRAHDGTHDYQHAAEAEEPRDRRPRPEERLQRR